MQTTVDTTPIIGVPGQLATEHDEHNARVDSGCNEEAATNIPFGVLVKRGTAKGLIKLPTTAADVFDGVVVHANEFDAESQLADATVNTFVQSAIKPGVTAGLVLEGTVLVIPEANGIATSGVHARIVASGGNVQLGSFTPTAEVAKTVNLTALARWVEPPVAGQPSPLWIDLGKAALITAD
jgi:hypothetical protein